eukprot:TRINITY_DN775856_c0_g1_i1.p1 TRINITY_DN775856_c0_g1~~TRINITY_DN775856_c0_g1_i1.p1  ORF type:complete len:180 (-),score=28.23 TRINITY_DN775856_c0_g1_i1:165-704(-)
MGFVFSKLFSGLFGEKAVRILILGLDNAGKTTILYRLKCDEPVTTIPTVGFNVESWSYKNIKFQVWDLGGQTLIRPYWKCYYPSTDAVVFVVDSADKERLDVTRQELSALLGEEELKKCVVLVFANKQDLKDSLDAGQISEALDLPSIKSHQWTIQECSALTGKGLSDGFDWLVDKLRG